MASNRTDTGENQISFEVVLATSLRQELRSCEAPAGTSIDAAIKLTDLADAFPDLALDALQVGVWGKITSRARPVRDGDRIELYRPLNLDPRDARRQLAVDGSVMGTSSTKDQV